jgi:hypothetical protein
MVRKKKWMAIELKDIKKYLPIEETAQFVGVGGKYLRE